MAFKFATTIPVRFRDLDPLNHVNNAVYLTYFEIARTEYMLQVGPYRDMRDFNFIVARAECNYRHGATANQMLRVECGVVQLGTRSFTMQYRITTDTMAIADGATVLVWYDYRQGQTMACPCDMRERIEAYDAELLAGRLSQQPET